MLPRSKSEAGRGGVALRRGRARAGAVTIGSVGSEAELAQGVVRRASQGELAAEEGVISTPMEAMVLGEVMGGPKVSPSQVEAFPCQWCSQMLAVPAQLQPSHKGRQKLRCGKCMRVSKYAVTLPPPDMPGLPLLIPVESAQEKGDVQSQDAQQQQQQQQQQGLAAQQSLPRRASQGAAGEAQPSAKHVRKSSGGSDSSTSGVAPALRMPSTGAAAAAAGAEGAGGVMAAAAVADENGQELVPRTASGKRFQRQARDMLATRRVTVGPGGKLATVPSFRAAPQIQGGTAGGGAAGGGAAGGGAAGDGAGGGGGEMSLRRTSTERKGAKGVEGGGAVVLMPRSRTMSMGVEAQYRRKVVVNGVPVPDQRVLVAEQRIGKIEAWELLLGNAPVSMDCSVPVVLPDARRATKLEPRDGVQKLRCGKCLKISKFSVFVPPAGGVPVLMPLSASGPLPGPPSVAVSRGGAQNQQPLPVQPQPQLQPPPQQQQGQVVSEETWLQQPLQGVAPLQAYQQQPQFQQPQGMGPVQPQQARQPSPQLMQLQQQQQQQHAALQGYGQGAQGLVQQMGGLSMGESFSQQPYAMAPQMPQGIGPQGGMQQGMGQQGMGQQGIGQQGSGQQGMGQQGMGQVYQQQAHAPGHMQAHPQQQQAVPHSSNRWLGERSSSPPQQQQPLHPYQQQSPMQGRSHMGKVAYGHQAPRPPLSGGSIGGHLESEEGLPRQGSGKRFPKQPPQPPMDPQAATRRGPPGRADAMTVAPRSSTLGGEGQYRRKVYMNGQPVPDKLVFLAERRIGTIEPGSYWYDCRAGFWGPVGGPAFGVTPAFMREFGMQPMQSDCSGGKTKVFVNGRELHKKDLVYFDEEGLSGHSWMVDKKKGMYMVKPQ
ncbi:unnamed protein product [Closterium sp. NIES-65]|nr:unnamed protein product [Closterium sp. NIES-65]